jgi:hypothetical protein
MSGAVRRFRVFIASPGDVSREREIARSVVLAVSNRLGGHGRFALEPVGWETHAELDAGRPQALINPLVREADVFIGILWSRLGTETGVAESGTVEEFAEAEQVRRETGERPTMMVFFSDAPVPMEQLLDRESRSQFDKVIAFRRRYEQPQTVEGAAGGLARHYRDAAEFERELRGQLEAWCGARFPRTPRGSGMGTGRARSSSPGRISMPMPRDYAEALEREIQLVSFIGPPSADPMRRPEVEAVYVPVQVERADPDGMRLRSETRHPQRMSFRTA